MACVAHSVVVVVAFLWRRVICPVVTEWPWQRNSCQAWDGSPAFWINAMLSCYTESFGRGKVQLPVALLAHGWHLGDYAGMDFDVYVLWMYVFTAYRKQHTIVT